MKWPDDLDGWPMASTSRKVLCKPHRWHVQDAGTGPDVLLIHGAGGATQSWRGLFPILAEHMHVIAIDLPGQGFTECGAKQRLGLSPMAEDVTNLIHQEGWAPVAIIGHSAGAAIALQMALSGSTAQIIGINAALSNFTGVAGWTFPLLAKALAISPLSSRVFTATATRDSVRNLITGTGSKLDERGLDLYLKLSKDVVHVDATLSMMAQWSLDGLVDRLNEISVTVDLIIADRDKAVPPASSEQAAKHLQNARCHRLQDLGHLAHEEEPEMVAKVIFDCLQAT